MEYTEDELAGLTDDERAALADEDTLEPESDDEDLDEDEGEGADADSDDAGAGQQPADAGTADSDDGDQPEPDTAYQQAPLLVAEAPADAQAQLQKIADDKAALVEQFDDGELTAKEYQQQLDALSKQERTIERALDKAQIAADLEHQRQVNEREAQINGFLSEIGVRRDFTDLRFAALDNAVKIIAGQEANADLGVREILEKAHALCIDQGVLPAARKGAKPEAAAAQKPARKPIETVPSLAKVPAAETTDTDEGNRFVHIDRIGNPVERERALQRLSPADQEAYLAGA